ncbi:phosphate uptake regulator PhoU [Corynebacterium sp. 13CS0277]|uniref:phosphate signaling complex PhoU family protein n=1 Tax=Corynebacterium sp. 13CS0277 TaxID=2071994 RepID=UPI00130504BD|nr:phosphate uptake regulator PhoU [Corynebacterium sp. 13CS0277]
MRDSYAQSLHDFSADVVSLAECVEKILGHANDALLHANRHMSDEALALKPEETAIRARCEERAVRLLATEGPVARDLRQVISSIYIVEELGRMAALGRHLARIARRRAPSPAIPADLRPYLAEMGRVALALTRRMRDTLADPDPQVASSLMRDDDAIDELHAYLFAQLTTQPWPHSTTEAIDVALASRFYERYADHAVHVGARVVYLATGLHQEDYLARREQELLDIETDIADLERRLNS